MAKRILAAVIVVVILVAGYYAWMRYRAENGVKNGDVLSSDVRDSDGGEARPTPSRSDAPDTINTAPAKQAQNTNTQSASMAQLQAQNNSVSSSAGTVAPVSDSLAPNAPNGAAFAGTGRFQVYRQGNLTWRVNTDNGSTCVLFATNEEWRKPIVYSHGCGNS